MGTKRTPAIYLMLGVLLVSTLASCNKAVKPYSNLCNGAIEEFSGQYPNGWPEFLKILDDSFIDQGGEITTDTNGNLGCNALVKGSQADILRHYRSLIASSGYNIQETSRNGMYFLTVKKTPQSKFFILTIGYEGFAIDERPGITPEDWVCYGFIVYPIEN